MRFRVCFEQVLLEGHVVLRLVGKSLAIAINDTGARERFLHNREPWRRLIRHTQGGRPPRIVHQARFRTELETG